MNQSFPFELVSPERLLLSEQAMQVVVPGTEGYFTVMANHAPVMTSIRIGIVEVKLENGSEKKILVRGGFADVSPISLTLLAEHAEDLENFDMNRLEKQIKNIQEDVADASTEEKRQKAKLTLNQMEHIKEVIDKTS